MKQTITKSIALLTLCLVFAVQSLAQTRDIGNFNALTASGSVSVKLEKADAPGIKYKMIKGNSDDLITTVKDNTLKVSIKNKWGMSRSTKAKVIVYYTELNDVHASAGASILGDQAISAESMEISCSSGASIKLEVEAEAVELGASSGASMSVSGKAVSTEMEASSGASISAKNLVSKAVEAGASSGASVSCHAVDSIEAEASSGGSVSYSGSPSQKDISNNRSGSVSHSGN